MIWDTVSSASKRKEIQTSRRVFTILLGPLVLDGGPGIKIFDLGTIFKIFQCFLLIPGHTAVPWTARPRTRAPAWVSPLLWCNRVHSNYFCVCFCRILLQSNDQVFLRNSMADKLNLMVDLRMKSAARVIQRWTRLVRQRRLIRDVLQVGALPPPHSAPTPA